MSLFDKTSYEACPTCANVLPTTYQMPLRYGEFAPRDPSTNRRQCIDCAAARALAQCHCGMDIHRARIIVHNERQKGLRHPDAVGVFTKAGFIRPDSAGDYELWLAWRKQRERIEWWSCESWYTSDVIRIWGEEHAYRVYRAKNVFDNKPFTLVQLEAGRTVVDGARFLPKVFCALRNGDQFDTFAHREIF